MLRGDDAPNQSGNIEKPNRSSCSGERGTRKRCAFSIHDLKSIAEPGFRVPKPELDGDLWN